MANKTTTPLKSALGGDIEKLNDKQTKSALSDAVGRLSKVTRLAEASKEQVSQTGTALMHSAETMGSLFMSSMAEGFLGPERIQLGGVDVRAPSGLLMQGYGLYQILSGESGGEHFLALGNGVTGSWLASVGQDAGKALRDRRNGGGQAPAPAPGTNFRGEEPMIQVHALEGDYGPGYGPGYGQGFAGQAQGGANYGGPVYGGPVYGGAAQYGVAGLLPPPSPPMNSTMMPSPQAGWQPYPAPQQVLQQMPQQVPQGQSYVLPGHLPNMAGPVREILPAAPPYAYEPAPGGRYPGHAGAPAQVQGNPATYPYPRVPESESTQQVHTHAQPPVLFVTPEPESTPTMRFTPLAPERAPVADSARPERAAQPRQDENPRDDVAGPRERFQERREFRQNLNNRFPRARRAEADEGAE